MLRSALSIILGIDLILSAEITNLPGQPPVSFKQYSGYISLPGTQKEVFYWFQESQGNPSKDPVALWTNGGPGCSGLAGALIEQGAFRIQANQSLSLNPGAWNQIANMLFIEQPVGVGFSYSGDNADYRTGDAQAAEDMYNFILAFFQSPDGSAFSGNEFYITSESYGGHYMPTLAKYIVDNDKSKAINFKGFLVGNPLTDMVENARGQYDTWYGHQLLPKPLWEQWYSQCGDGANRSTHCFNLEQQMTEKAGNIYPYGIDWPVCLDDAGYHDTRYQLDNWFMQKVVSEAFGRPIPSYYQTQNEKRALLAGNWDKCAVDYLTTYLNNKDVQTALHAKVGTDWALCSDLVKYNETDVNTPMEPYYTYLVNGGFGLKMAIYSGDDDSVCGTLGTQSWVFAMGWDVQQSWKSWKYDGQTAGYTVKFKNAIDLYTIHSAGHQVPWFKPMRGFQIFQTYLQS